jgi:transposase
MGNILAVNVHKANQHDTKGGIFVFEKALFLYPRIIAGCADEGYRGTFKNTFEEFHNIRIDISKQIKPIFEVLPKRWRIERTFSWFALIEGFPKILNTYLFLKRTSFIFLMLIYYLVVYENKF